MSGFRLARCAVIAAAALLCAAAGAEAQQQGRIRGEIEKADGAALVVKTREGATMQVRLADDARVAALEKATLADLKPDSFIGIAGMPRPDGSIEAFSIHVFQAAQRGVVADRHGPWDARQGSTMTNAYVEGIGTEKDGDTLKVKYKDGEKTVHVNAQTVIATTTKAERSELKPGAQIIIMGWDKQPDGSAIAKSMYVGRGVKPAM
jgi:hypothetical protein